MAKKKVIAKKKTAKRVASRSGVSLKPKGIAVTANATASLLKVGQKAPAFTLLNETEEKVMLSALKGKKVLLFFYPKDNTPGCTQESCDFRDSYSRLKKHGVEVFGISKDSAKSHVKFKTKFELPFSLLVDVEGKVCEAYGVWKEKSLYGRKYMGIERSTFLIDENGKILKVYPKVSVKGHVDAIIADIGASK